MERGCSLGQGAGNWKYGDAEDQEGEKGLKAWGGADERPDI